MKKKKTYKMWGLFWPDGTLVLVGHTKKELTPKFNTGFPGVKVKRVTVVEGDLNEISNDKR